MKYAIIARDGEGMLEKRLAVRQTHMERLQKADGKIVCAGGLLDEEGKMKGSVIIMDFETKEALDNYLKNEPYMAEGVWEIVDVEVMNVVFLDGEKIGK